MASQSFFGSPLLHHFLPSTTKVVVRALWRGEPTNDAGHCHMPQEMVVHDRERCGKMIGGNLTLDNLEMIERPGGDFW